MWAMQKVLRQTDQLKNIEMSETQLQDVITAQMAEINRLKALIAELLEALKSREDLTYIDAGALL
jgi:predicted nuclease with TOPRIM domain